MFRCGDFIRRNLGGVIAVSERNGYRILPAGVPDDLQAHGKSSKWKLYCFQLRQY